MLLELCQTVAGLSLCLLHIKWTVVAKWEVTTKYEVLFILHSRINSANSTYTS